MYSISTTWMFGRMTSTENHIVCGDESLEGSLLEQFELPPEHRIRQLSKGMRIQLALLLGFASQGVVWHGDNLALGHACRDLMEWSFFSLGITKRTTPIHYEATPMYIGEAEKPMSIDLTQAEADQLIAMPKRTCNEDVQIFPSLGDKLVIEFESVDKTEDFLLDVSRSRIDFCRITYQNRGRIVVVLKRLDLNGPPHRNPDDQVVPCPHLHTYRGGYGDKWAEPVPPGKYSNLTDLSQTLGEFMAECNVVNAPAIQTRLF